MKRFLLVLFSGILLLGQTPTNRPSVTSFASFNTKQVKLATLTSGGYSYHPPSPSQNNPQGDVYLGDNQGAGGTLSIGTITGSVTITFQDLNSYQLIPGGVFTTSLANINQPLTYLNGAWLQQGFKISCTDTSSGVDCGLVKAELIWRE
jgi:hypothetical protein